MRYNLKNKPSLDTSTPSKTIYAVSEWFEGFEKELRERMKQYAEEGSIGGDIIAQEYKEILGE